MGPKQKQIMWFNNIFTEIVKRKKWGEKSLSNPEALIRTCQNMEDARRSQQSRSLSVYCMCVTFENTSGSQPPNVWRRLTLRSMICLLDFQSEYNGLEALAAVGLSVSAAPTLLISSSECKQTRKRIKRDCIAACHATVQFPRDKH